MKEKSPGQKAVRATWKGNQSLAVAEDSVDFANLTLSLDAFPLGRFTGFFVELAAADFGQDSGLFTGLLKAAHKALHRFTLAGFDKWHG